MPIKGISWIEQHCEKIVVGVFGTALLGIVAMQFVGGTSTVSLSIPEPKGTKVVPIDQAMQDVEDAAKRIHDRITAPTPSELAGLEGKVPGGRTAATAFSPGTGRVAPRPTLVSVLDSPRLKLGSGPMGESGGSAGNFMYAAVSAPAPEKPAVAVNMSTVHPIEYVDLPAVKAILPADPAPKDMASVSVETSFNGLEYAAVLGNDPDGAGPLTALPSHWWNRDATQVLAVQLERQILLPNGEWGAAEKVAPMPGRATLAEQIKTVGASGPDAMKSLVEEAKAAAAAIRRPEYYASVFGADWMTPSEAVLVADSASIDSSSSNPRVANLQKAKSDIERELGRLDEEYRRLDPTGAPGRPTPPNARPPAPAPGPGGGKGAPPPAGGDRNAPPTRDPKEERRRGLDARRTKLQKDMADIVDNLGELGVLHDSVDPHAPRAAISDK